jgi:hypothetical protein
MTIEHVTDKPRRNDHEAVIGVSVLYFVFAFTVDQPLNIYDAADRLLRAGIAETVATTSDREVRVSPRYRRLARLLRRASTLASISTLVSSGRRVRALCEHPILFTRLFGAAIINRVLRRNLRSPKSFAATLKTLKEAYDHIQQSVASSQAVNAIQQHIEQRLLRPAYLESDPYVRLRLRHSAQWLTLKDGGVPRSSGDYSDGTMVEALLLLHRSGVMQLTFAVQLPRHLSTDTYADMTFGMSPIVAASELAEPIIRNAAQSSDERRERNWLGEWIEEIIEGTRWRRMEFDQPSSIRDLFLLYRDAIINVIKAKLIAEWQCYPVICIDRTDCCSTRDKWMKRHALELAELAVRVDRTAIRRSVVSKLVPVDRSVSVNLSHFVTLSNSIAIFWNTSSAETDFADHFSIIVPVEIALLQYWQLRAMEARFANVRRRPGKARSLQLEAIYGLQEFRQSSFMHGSATEIVDDLLTELRAERLHQRILESLDQLQQLASADEARRSSRRENILAMAAFIAALAFGLPAIEDTLRIAARIPDDGVAGSVAEPLRDLASQGAGGAWKGYLALLLIAALLGLALLFYRRRRVSLGADHKRAGQAWPLGTVEVAEGGPDEDK